METYAPSPTARKEAIRACAVGIACDRSPVQIVAEMSWRCIMTDFNGEATTAQNEAVMTFNVAFMASISKQIDDHMNGEWTTTPRDD